MKITILTHRETFKLKLEDQEQIDFMKEMLIGDESETAINPFSKVKVTLDPEAIAIYDWLVGVQRVGNWSQEKIDKFHLALHIFRNNWPDEYMKLLD